MNKQRLRIVVAQIEHNINRALNDKQVKRLCGMRNPTQKQLFAFANGLIYALEIILKYNKRQSKHKNNTIKNRLNEYR